MAQGERVKPHPGCPQCSLEPVRFSADERFDWMEDFKMLSRCDACPWNFDWMEFFGLNPKSNLSLARYSWLWIQSAFNKRLADPMPGDPQPEWWVKNNEAIPKPRKPVLGGSLIDRLKAAYRVEDVASRHTDLHGTNVLKGKCPIHGEQRGEAFVVWVGEQKWKCFGACQSGGDVIDLIRALHERKLNWTNS